MPRVPRAGPGTSWALSRYSLLIESLGPDFCVCPEAELGAWFLCSDQFTFSFPGNLQRKTEASALGRVEEETGLCSPETSQISRGGHNGP